MKKKSSAEFLQGLEELSMEETMGIIGGESLWYWVGYGLGAATNYISHLSGA